ncbi:hypothetical protein PM03_14760 [Thalassobacter stenotrophicus]|uniref:MBG domain-containing protein n=1 Tax=Thalassobacter TaxID=266808 RepID=UPI00051CD9BC|nr:MULTISPECIES: MBG domain-containing protein [Thalassobacter]KGK78462.1 hypothetical protein PM03_14760 [Thalassobacter stenotrophicus]KGL00397.1 hypothetical protein PM04_14950 [Thalassobacter sp. 16PALIMAR09]
MFEVYPRQGRLAFDVASFLAFSLLIFIQPVSAEGPQAGVVAAGTAAISQSGNTTTITQGSDRAIIDWRSFNLAPGHSVNFVQPGQNAATLNRVQSFSPSVIEGRITAPGTVVIQNAAGVMMTGDAVIDVGGFVATSQIVAPGVFFERGDLRFGGGNSPGAEVSNAGQITVADAGLAALVGRNVANSGVIVARLGTVVLASGERTTIDLAGDGVFQIDVSGSPVGGSVDHSGVIDAPGGQVLMTAGGAVGLLDNVINTSGVVRATSGSIRGGEISLIGRGAGTVRVAGTLEASGADDGGTIRVTGERVRIEAAAVLDARGAASGGRIFVGGERQGTGDMRRAEHVVLHTGSTVQADGAAALGGEVIVWADASTWFDGTITASGREGGGFIETSAKDALGNGENAVVMAGVGGSWLLDPRNVRIVSGSGATAIAGSNAPPSGPGDYQIVGSTIVDALNRDENVTITTAQPTSSDAGDITLDTSLIWRGGGDLSLEADNTITVNADVRTEGAGDLALNAEGDIQLNWSIASTSDGNISARSEGAIVVDRILTMSGAGDVTLTAGRDITVNRQIVSVRDGDISLTAANDVRLNDSVSGKGAGDVSILAQAGDIALGGSVEDQFIATNSGDIMLEATTGRVLIERTNAVPFRTSVNSRSGDIDIVAGTEIRVAGGDGVAQASEIGGSRNSSDVTLTAPTISVLAGDGGSRSTADIIGGLGGSLSINTDALVVENGDAGARGSVQGLNGADLTINSPSQTWDGFVRGSGDVTLTGDITASVRPRFILDPGANFSLNTTEPSNAFEAATVPLHVATTGGVISMGGGVEATQVSLRTDTGVNLAAGTSVTGTARTNAIVVEAGPSFNNAAGTDVFRTTDTSARWLLYMDRFNSLTGTEPASGTFDLYNRTYASAPPDMLRSFTGNRIIYGEQPDLTVTAVSGAKTYGDDLTGTLQVRFAGFRTGDSEATAFDAPLVISSTGAPGSASVSGGPYVINVTPQVSSQGYSVTLQDGTLAVLAAPLTISADDVSRAAGQPNPTFTATSTGLVLGETLTDLSGALTFSTPATQASAAGTYSVTPSGVSSPNYDISFVDGTLSIGAGAPGTAGTAGQIDGVVSTIRTTTSRAAPLTPGDAAFRTTIRDIGLANANPFTLNYSLGQVLAFAPAADPGTQGFVPAAGGLEDESLGFVPAAGGLDVDEEPTSDRDTCGVAVNLGGTRNEECVGVTITETYWDQ